MRTLFAFEKSWPVAGAFSISRSSLTNIPTVWVQITENGYTGRAECRPYARYGDTVQSVLLDIQEQKDAIENDLDIAGLNKTMRPGPARNALDCALWDLKAKQSQRSIAALLGISEPKPRVTAYTLSLQSPKDMAKSALQATRYPLLKIKVDKSCALNCTLAVIEARPDAKLIIDANEDLDEQSLEALTALVPHSAIAMIEQPIHADEIRKNALPTNVIVCADESLHSETDIEMKDLEVLWNKGFRAVNIKLDKCGGLTAAHQLMEKAKVMDFQIMAGCMVGSSLAMAPMLILESFADVMDMDGPLLLSGDCEEALDYQGSIVPPPSKALWG